MKFYTAQETIRLTLSQAIVKYLQAQHSERDGVERRFIQGVWGILGHGNVSGLSQALVEYGRDLPFHQPANEQSMVHAASGFARANRRLATMACTSSIGPGTTNMLTGATHRHHLPPARTASPLRLLRIAVPGARFSRTSSTPCPWT